MRKMTSKCQLLPILSKASYMKSKKKLLIRVRLGSLMSTNSKLKRSLEKLGHTFSKRLALKTGMPFLTKMK